MSNSKKRLLIVAGHAIYDQSRTINSYFTQLYPHLNVELPADCYWHGFEADKFPGDALKQMIGVVELHVRYACGLVKNGQYDIIAFSGGKTRKELHDPQDEVNHKKQGINNSEGEGMRKFAEQDGCLASIPHFTEQCASDSFTNVFYSILGYHKKTQGNWPEKIGVISMPHKSTRFHIMALGLGYKDERFEFHGIGSIPNIEFNVYREIENMATLIDRSAPDEIQDPLLRDINRFERKRAARLHPDCDPREHYGDNGVRSTALTLWENTKVGRNEWMNCVHEWPWTNLDHD